MRNYGGGEGENPSPGWLGLAGRKRARGEGGGNYIVTVAFVVKMVFQGAQVIMRETSAP